MDDTIYKPIRMFVHLFLIVCLPGFMSMAQEITVTRSWVDCYGSVKWSNEDHAEPGTHIQVFDSENILCGEFTVKADGEYGFMAVYGDDPLTAMIDEGGREGDTLSFTINGAPAHLQSGGNAVWSQQYSAINVDLISTETKVENEKSLPLTFGLQQNYPNPFNPSTTIQYQLPEKCRVTLTVYNVIGQAVITVIDETKEPGRYASVWDGREESGAAAPSGLYLYRLEAGRFCQTRKMLLYR